jgi:hypothetical protein
MFGTAICGRTVQYPIRGSMAAIRGIGGVVRFLIFPLRVVTRITVTTRCLVVFS